MLPFKIHYYGLLLFFLSFLTGCNLPEGSSKQSTSSIKKQPILPPANKTKSVLKETFHPLADTIPYNQYLNGKKEGLWREFDKEGRLSLEGYYKDGQANGWMRWYYEGKLMALGPMKDNEREGLWRICDVHHPNECIEASFEAGKKTGPWETYYDHGQLQNRQQWEAGTLLSEECWNAQGQPINCPNY